MMSVVIKSLLRHLAAYDGQPFSVIHILARFTVLVDEKAHTEFRPRGENCLYGLLHAIKVNIVSQLGDTRNIILHHLRIFQAVVKHAQLGL